MKFKFGFLLLAFCFWLFAENAHAQFQNPNYLNTNPDVPQNLHTYTQNVFINIAAAASCILTGIDPINLSGKCLGVDTKTGKIGYTEGGGGLIGITGNMIAMTFEIPVSSTHYGKYLADNFGITKKSYAEGNTGVVPGGGQTTQKEDAGGVGFGGLKPLLELWKVFRNMVYLFFVLVFVIIGLGIMFRIKIDPRTVMTLQNQIPKIIIALVLVTFSYAIVGFLIDLMYVFLYLTFNVFSSYAVANKIDIQNFNPRVIQGSNPLSAVGILGGLGIAIDAASGLGGIISSLFDGTFGRIIAGLIGSMIGGGAGALGGVPGAIIGGIIGGIGGAVLGSSLLGVVGGLVAFVVIAAALLSALFRLWFQLLKAYIFILINTVLAPFYIAAGLVPGSSINFGYWLRDMIGNLAPFPVVLILFLLGKVFIQMFGVGSDQYFTPPFIGNPGNTKNFGALIGLGIILLTPNVVTIVRQMIKAPETKIGEMLGQPLAVGAGVVGAGPQLAWQRLMRQPRWAGDTGGPMYHAIHGMPGPIGRVIRTITGVHAP